MQHIEKEVIEYLRAGDILIDRLKSGKALTAEETKYIEGYTARITSLLASLNPTEKGKDTHITIRFTGE